MPQSQSRWLCSATGGTSLGDFLIAYITSYGMYPRTPHLLACVQNLLPSYFDTERFCRRHLVECKTRKARATIKTSSSVAMHLSKLHLRRCFLACIARMRAALGCAADSFGTASTQKCCRLEFWNQRLTLLSCRRVPTTGSIELIRRSRTEGA